MGRRGDGVAAPGTMDNRHVPQGTGASSVLMLVPESQRPHPSHALGEIGLTVVVTHTLRDCLRRLSERHWLATVVSFSCEWVDATVVERIAGAPGVGALLLTAPGASLERALLAERVGAIGLVREPFSREELGARIAPLLDEGPEVPLPSAPSPGPGTDGTDDHAFMVGDSPAMARVFERIARVAGSDSTVLVTGPSGTGKELVARALHEASPRRRGPFVAVNCAAIPEQLLETELFGHEKGAFTGAVGSRIGRFERAHGGTLLLDEIGDMSLVLQAKLLRTLEERSVEPIGGTAPRDIDVRVVAATHRDLRVRIEEGSFREDLYYRLAVVDVALPPLRERGEDVRTLALHFAARFARRHGRQVRAISQQALERLQHHDWPGNVRELRNVIDRAVLLTTGPVIGTGSLRMGDAAPRLSSAAPISSHGYPTSLSLAEVEADHIARVLASHEGQISKAAEALGIHRNTLTRKLQQHGLTDGATDL